MDAASISPECTCAALRKAARRASRAYDDALAPEGLTVSQFSILATLGRWENAPTVQVLAERLVLDRTTLGHNLRPLQRDGLVELRADPADRRARLVRLTKDGIAKLIRATPFWRAVQDRFDAAFGLERSARLRDELRAVAYGNDLFPTTATGEPSAHAL